MVIAATQLAVKSTRADGVNPGLILNSQMENVDKVSTLMLMRVAPERHAHRVAGSKLWEVMSTAQQRGKFKSLQSHKEEMSQVALPEHNCLWATSRVRQALRTRTARC